MAFPTTGTLYPGTGTDQSPATGFTDAPDGGTYGGIKRLSNVIRSITTDSYDYWTTPDFGPDAEVWLEGLTWPTSAATTQLELRLASVGSSAYDGYNATMRYDSLLRIFRIDNGVYTKLGADISSTWAKGDGFGADVVGSTFTAYKKNAGTWTSLGSRTDATYSAAGKLAVYLEQADMTATNFGGGTVVPAVTRRQLASTGVGT